MALTLETTGNYSEDFARIGLSQSGWEPEWLTSLRQSAMASFSESGFPTRRDEDWRFTPIPRIVETPFRLAEAAQPHGDDVNEYAFGGLGGDHLVFVDGRYAPALSTVRPYGKTIRIGSLAQLLREDPGAAERYLGRAADPKKAAFTSLNTAFFRDGACLIIPRGAVIDGVVHVLYLSSESADPQVSYPRTLIVAGENSQATIVESYASSAGDLYFTNAVTEFYIGANAAVDHYKLTREGSGAQHVATTQILIDRAATFTSHNIILGGSLVRNDFNAHLQGEGIVCTLNGLYMARDRQLVDNHTFIDHAVPNCESHEIYKGILTDRSRGVFNGKILVRPDAQKTDAKQTNKTLLLSKEATIDTKPQLEIFADDVKCTHGATVGQADEEAIFYLRSRGIGQDDARSLMVYAFASDIISRIPIPPIRERMDRALFTEGALQAIK